MTPAALRQLRLDLDLSQQAFGRLIQVSRGTIEKWENGKTPISRYGKLALERLTQELATQRAGQNTP